MKLSNKEKQEIAQMVANILTDKQKVKVNKNWILLRKQIREYCKQNNTNVRWPTLQEKIYDAIRAVISISRLSEMTDYQVIEARKVFEFIKEERAKAAFQKGGDKNAVVKRRCLERFDLKNLQATYQTRAC